MSEAARERLEALDLVIDGVRLARPAPRSPSISIEPSDCREPAYPLLVPRVSVVTGDLLEQDVEIIVNAWNRNIIP